ncbi:MAG: hypothetical protein IAA73_08375 [Bacteroidetes bacterium]|uniref:Uncharacterized protein n=1 Tax=Candidatus Gallipaludibacter merdavium TaxID=2840839 RepID=A0A9D9HV12_9BACT|nr:hypothetical protein [Candidatus Gallipaludibacter merdavium]
MKSQLKRWKLYVLIFIGTLCTIILICRCTTLKEFNDSNLLVNSVLAAILTGLFILIDQIIRRHKQ